MAQRSNPFRGRWRIVSTDVWDVQSLNEFEPAQITFGRSLIGRGTIHHFRGVDERAAFGRRACRPERYNQDHQRPAGNIGREKDL
jgi:hypothetical protein